MRKKIKSSLSVKVFLWVFLALSICSMLIYGFVMAVVPQHYQLSYDTQLEASTKTLFTQLEKMTYSEAVEEIFDFCIFNHAAAILSYDTERLHFGKMEENTEGLSSTSLAAEIRFTDKENTYTLIVFSLSQTAATLSALFFQLIPLIFAVVFSLSIISALLCSRVIVAPIAGISRISRRMADLDLAWRCDIKGSDEISVLAHSLNTMAGRLKATMDKLENANRQLSADVKKFQTLEEQRRNFFAAVSHELKTPLTVLKGQLENMILGYGDYQNHEKYLPEALGAAEGIEHLVMEILAITKMESMDLANSTQNVSLMACINTTLENFYSIAKDKCIQIHQNIDKNLILSVNSNLWHKALSNIIGNAVGHSPCGEHIFISLQTHENKYTLVIENTGAFIQEAALPHMFTPFYRVDRSRNRETGGSGLGLYIVKTILDLHGMAYGIQNTPGGVKFYVCLN